MCWSNGLWLRWLRLQMGWRRRRFLWNDRRGRNRNWRGAAWHDAGGRRGRRRCYRDGRRGCWRRRFCSGFFWRGLRGLGLQGCQLGLQFADGALEAELFAFVLFASFAEFAAQSTSAEGKSNQPDWQNEQKQAVENRDEVEQLHEFCLDEQLPRIGVSEPTTCKSIVERAVGRILQFLLGGRLGSYPVFK